MDSLGGSSAQVDGYDLVQSFCLAAEKWQRHESLLYISIFNCKHYSTKPDAGQVSNCCARFRNSPRKASVRAVSRPRHKTPTYYWGKVVELQDTDVLRSFGLWNGDPQA